MLRCEAADKRQVWIKELHTLRPELFLLFCCSVGFAGVSIKTKPRLKVQSVV